MFAIIFDFKTYINDDIDDMSLNLSFIPTKDMNLHIDKEWYSVEDIDYLLKEDLFVISLKELEGIQK